MADINIDMMLADSSGSIGKRTNETKALNGELTKTQKLARSAFASQGASAPSGAELEGYNKVRGSVGTGAAGRDFANQAQGLGGVVRLYATFAANIFAVSSAFQNLQKAAQFENLMIASKMMTERVGIDMRSLAKSLQEAAGYALSFEDAMQFANLGVSAKIAGEDLKELVTIAKGAAAGLGRDVQDSIRRIIQGTAKQEQEILDELGIFIKAKDAYEKYAKKFNIQAGADALSASQRVAAYADAVKEAGAKWKDFAKIDDPFARFTATGKDALVTLLNLINQGIKPLISFLADSKEALIAITALLSTVLLKRALPELKTLAIDLFTFSSAKAKAEAAQQRISIAKEMALTSNLIQDEQAKLAALMAKTPITAAVLPQTFGGMMANTRKGEVGVSSQRLTTAFFGEKTDLSKYKSVADVEKTISGIIQQQVKGKAELLDKMKAAGLVEQASTEKSVLLGQQLKTSSLQLYKIIDDQNKGLLTKEQTLARILALNEKNAAAEARLTSIEPGKVQAIKRDYGGVPLAPVPAATGLAGRMGATTGGVVGGYGAVAESTSRLKDVVGAGPMVQLKSFFNVLGDNIDRLGQMSSASQKVGASVGIMGQLIGGAFRGIMAAFGPLMIIWTLWELFGTKLMPESWKQTQILKEKQENLAQVGKDVTVTYERFNKMLVTGTTSAQEYGYAIDTVINATKSEIAAIKEVLVQIEKVRQARKPNEAAKKATEEYGKEFARIASLPTQEQAPAMAALRQKQMAEFEKMRTKALTVPPEVLEGQSKLNALLKSGMADPKIVESLKSLQEEYDKYNEKQDKDLSIKEGLLIRLARLMGLNEQYQQNIRSETQVIENNQKATDEALDSLGRKLKNMPKFGEFAGTEEARAFAKQFSDTFDKPLIDEKTATIALGSVKTRLQELSQKGVPEAKAAFEVLQRTQGDSAQEVLKNAGSNDLYRGTLKNVILALNKFTSDFGPAAQQTFLNIAREVDKLTVNIKELDLQLAKANAFDDRLKSIRGYSTGLEIAAKASLELQKAEKERDKEIATAREEMLKITEAKGAAADPEGTQRARERFAVREKEARIGFEINKQNIQNKAVNESLATTLTLISMKYEVIARKTEIQNAVVESSLKIEQERLRILREARALSEPKLVDLETIQQQKEIQSRYDQARKAATDAASKEREELDAKARSASEGIRSETQLSAIIAAQAEQRARLTEKERDALNLASIRRDTDIEILKISSAAKKIYAELAEEEKKLAQAEALRQERSSTETQLLEILKQELTFKRDMGMITEEAYTKEVQALEKNMRAREFNNKQLEIERNYKAEIARIDAAERAATATSLVEDREGNKIIDPQQLAEFERQRGAAGLLRNTQLSGAKQVYEGNERLREQMASMGEDQMKLRDIYKNTFSSMGDALVDFVRTGKMNFKSLINDMLASIAKLYMNKIFMQLFASMFGAPAPTNFGTAGFSSPGAASPWAKGGAFTDTGVMKYAKGGTFTNSIVSQPTLFKFAKGTGLMGEAGPEAIMPLKRDSQGNLGVRAQGGSNVEVVVNNYSPEKAETRETTDSRGNRKIEVTIGDMTAGEVSRSGSSTNRAIQGTFGLQPQLIRR